MNADRSVDIRKERQRRSAFLPSRPTTPQCQSSRVNESGVL